MVKTPQACTEKWRRRVSAFQDGDVSVQERRAVEQHLQTCEQCRQILQSYQGIYAKINTLQELNASLSFLPSFPELHQKTSSLKGGKFSHRSFSLGSIAAFITMLVVVFSIIKVHEFRSNAASSATQMNNAAPVINTVLAGAESYSPIKTPNGTPCADAHASQPMDYMYAGANGTLWKVVSCNDPVNIGTISPVNFHLGAISPDGKYVAVFTPDIPEFGMTRQFLIWDIQRQMRKTVEMFGTDAQSQPNSVNEAEWEDSNHVLTLNAHSIMRISLPAMSVQHLPITNAGHIVVRGTMLYYSTISGNTVTLYSYNLMNNQQTAIAAIRSGVASCPDTGLCREMTLWDVSADGSLLAYQHSEYQPVQILNLESGMILTQISLPSQTFQLNKMSFSPDGRAFAILGKTANDVSNTVGIYAARNELWHNDIVAHTEKGYDSFYWRADSEGLLVEPRHQSNQYVPFMINVNTMNHDINLIPSTSDYVWFENGT